MTIADKLAVVPALGLAVVALSPANIDEKPRSCADWGIPKFEATTPSLVKDDYRHTQPVGGLTTTKIYNIQGIKIVTLGTSSRVDWLFVNRHPYSQTEIYRYFVNNRCERVN